MSAIKFYRLHVRTAAGRLGLNLNSLFITVRTKQHGVLPLRMASLNLAHEILHSFGAEHDPVGEECGAGERAGRGRYLMSRYSSSGVRANNARVSRCTAGAVAAVLQSDRATCLSQAEPLCGDGAVDPGEECDCGPAEHCVAERSSCVPPGLRRGERECRMRVPRSRDCSRLGLVTCSCPGNSVHCGSCCAPPAGRDCRPAPAWTRVMFGFMQRHLSSARCWSRPARACLSQHSKWRALLNRLSRHHRPGRQPGPVFCLKTAVDSNCWQPAFHCLR